MEVLFVDMDNVLVNFEWGVEQLSDKEKEACDHEYDEIPGFFRDLPPIDGALEAYQELSSQYDTYLLSTASWHNPSAWKDKLLWVQEHLPETGYKRLNLSHHKNLSHGDYLIDDRTVNGAAEFMGEHIHFGEPPFEDWEAVLGYLM